MSGRGRGRPQITKREYWTRVLWLEALVEEEEAAMRWQGRKPVKALARAAIRLDMSYRSARRLLSPTGGHIPGSIDWSTTPLGAALRKLRDEVSSSGGSTFFRDFDFLATDSCGSD